jgi:hypothetical protein
MKHDRFQADFWKNHTAIAGVYDAAFRAGSTRELMETFRGMNDRFGVGRVLETFSPCGLNDTLGLNLASVLGTVSLVTAPWKNRFGVLSPLNTFGELGLTWPNQDESPSISAGVIRKRHEDLPPIEIETQLVCQLCGSHMPTSSADLSWEGNLKAVMRIPFVAGCLTCMRRFVEDPESFRQTLDEHLRPRFRLITGGDTDGIKRGTLRLVERDETDDDD